MTVIEKNRYDWNSFSGEYMKSRQSEEILAGIKKNPWMAFPENVRSFLSDEFGDLYGKKICVPSSGDNHGVFAFALMGAQVTSCDFSEEQIKAAKNSAEKLDILNKITFLCENTMTLDSVPSDYYDFVFTSNGVFVWLDDLNSAFANFNRVLKKHGKYIFYDVHSVRRPFDENCVLKKAYDKTGPFEDEYNINFHWRLEDLVMPLLKNGFSLEDFHEIMDDSCTEKLYNLPKWINVSAGKIN